MGKKYIVELDDNKLAYTAIIIDGVPYIKPLQLLPYTEPEPHAEVTADAYQRGYEQGQKDLRESCVPQDEEAYGIGYHEGFQQGLGLAWEAARKIVLDTDKGGIPLSKLQQIFHRGSPNEIIGAFSVAEAIKKVRQYEQEQDRQARIEYNFDEIKDVLETTAKECNVSLDEIAEVLRKMGETNNG